MEPSFSEVLNSRAVVRLVEAHAARFNPPLLLAVRFDLDSPDVHLLEVFDGLPDPPREDKGYEPGGPPEFEFAPSADLLMAGRLRLALASPKWMEKALLHNPPIIQQLRRDGRIEFCSPEGRALAERLGLKERASSIEQRARRTLLEESGMHIGAEDIDRAAKMWA